MSERVSRRAILLAGASLMTAVSGATIIANARKTSRTLSGVSSGAAVRGLNAIRLMRDRPRTPVGYTVPLVDIPLGGGIIYIEQLLVVTQPEPGDYRALHSKCPHDNCDVGDIRDGSIICFCHGTYFSLTGARERGPTRKSLTKLESQVVGDSLIVTDIPPEGIAGSLRDDDCGCGGPQTAQVNTPVGGTLHAGRPENTI